MPNFVLESRAKKLPDLQRSFMWELVIPSVQGITGVSEEDWTIRVRSASMVGRSIETIESSFMGFKQYFPGKTTFPSSFECQIEETQDQKIKKGITAWQDAIFNTQINSPTGGTSQVASKRLGTRDIYLLMYKYNGELMDKKYRFYNAWPSAIADAALSYTESSQIIYNVTFTFDIWNLE